MRATVISLSQPLFRSVLIDSLSGTQILKCQEGLYNKAFILSMENGSEVVAKLPCAATGSKHYTTASEVATREFVSSNRR